LSHELAQESDGSGSPLLPRSVPYSSEIKIVEFLLNDFELLFLRLFRFSRGFGCFWGLNILFDFLGDLLGFFFGLFFER